MPGRAAGGPRRPRVGGRPLAVGERDPFRYIYIYIYMERERDIGLYIYIYVRCV